MPTVLWCSKLLHIQLHKNDHASVTDPASSEVSKQHMTHHQCQPAESYAQSAYERSLLQLLSSVLIGAHHVVVINILQRCIGSLIVSVQSVSLIALCQSAWHSRVYVSLASDVANGPFKQLAHIMLYINGTHVSPECLIQFVSNMPVCL